MDCHYIVLILTISTIIIPTSHGLESDNIIGGMYAKKGQFKYQVAIFRDSFDVCGGALIRPHLVLTAAHCVIDNDEFTKQVLKVVAGIVQLQDASEDRIEIGVRKIYVPKEFRLKVFWFDDIAILKLLHKFDFKRHPHIGAVQLPTNNFSFAGRKGVIAGFGWSWVAMVEDPDTHEPDEMGYNFESRMNYVQVGILKNSECRFLHEKNSAVNRKQLCGQTHKVMHYLQEAPCSGDSGSPLVVGGTIVGILSTSPDGCDEREEAAIYTRVSEYLPFIESVLNHENHKSMKIYKIPKEMRYYPMRRCR